MGALMTKRAVLYARVSGDDRAKEGRNLAGQLEMCRQYALERGYQIVAELAEDERGARGADRDLPMLNKALDMAEADEFDVLVVRELDRFARRLAKQLVKETQFQDAGVSVEYVLGQYPDTPEGSLHKNIGAVIAEYERLKIAERLARGRRQKVKGGNVLVSGRPPYGYEVAERDGKTVLAICEKEARIVRLMFQWYTEGDGSSGPLSLNGVTRKLNDLGAPTFTDTGKHPQARAKTRRRGEWARSVVYQIMKNPAYAGRWTYGKSRRIEGKRIANPEEHWITLAIPAIVDRETWDVAQRRLAENRRAFHARKYDYLLAGRAKCGLSGHNIQGNSSIKGDQVYLYYHCAGKHKSIPYADSCTLPTFRADLVDAKVWADLRAWLSDPEQMAAGLETCQDDRAEELGRLREQLQAVQDGIDRHRARLGRVVDLFIDGTFERETLDERRQEIEATLGRLEAQREELAATIEALQAASDHVAGLQEFARRIGPKLAYADQDFASRRQIVETLNLWATLTVEDGEQVVRAFCQVDEDTVWPLSDTISGHGLKSAPCA
jgi:site-specific DNA recombinase